MLITNMQKLFILEYIMVYIVYMVHIVNFFNYIFCRRQLQRQINFFE
jgi:hypothetical protein